ncbi:hypothetical protein PIROE2DRAFT_60972 [Piromyces sp. E2]|nr:hypothetical protein PIROE2DRAFT_60972 [Piromyces sp. E2]|eukprot:OUM63941.1 hypothetical protein PIROE2DRAFT_60972 [Piromyces sp. E2]
MRDIKDCVIWNKNLNFTKYNNNYYKISTTADDDDDDDDDDDSDPFENISDLTISSGEREQHQSINNIKKTVHHYHANTREDKKIKRARNNSNTSENSNLTSASTITTETTTTTTTTSGVTNEMDNYQDDITYSELLNNPMKKHEIYQMEKSHYKFMKSWLDFENKIYYNLNYFIKNDFIDLYDYLCKKHGTLELKSIKCQIGGPYLNRPEKNEDDCEKIRKKTRIRQNNIIKAFECFQRNKIASLNTANTVNNNSYRLKSQPIFLYSLNDLDISTESLEQHPTLENDNPLINFVPGRSKHVFENELRFETQEENDNNDDKDSNPNNLKVSTTDNKNILFPTKSYFILNNHKVRRLNNLKEENENGMNSSCNLEKHIEDDTCHLTSHPMSKLSSCSTLSISNMKSITNLNNNINKSVNRLPCVEKNSSSNVSFDFTYDHSLPYKRNVDNEDKKIQKTRDELMEEYIKTVLQYKDYINRNRVPQMLPKKEKVNQDYNNHSNNKLFKKKLKNNINPNNRYNKSLSLSSSSSSSSINIQDSQNSIYIGQLRRPLQQNITLSSRSTTSNNVDDSSSKEQLSHIIPQMMKLDKSTIKSFSQIPDISLDKNRVPLTIETLIARNVPVIESKFPVSRVYWMKNVASNF